MSCENIPIKGSLCVFDTSRPLIASDLDGHFLDPRKYPVWRCMLVALNILISYWMKNMVKVLLFYTSIELTHRSVHGRWRRRSHPGWSWGSVTQLWGHERWLCRRRGRRWHPIVIYKMNSKVKQYKNLIMGHSLHWSFTNGTFEIWMGHSRHGTIHPNHCDLLFKLQNVTNNSCKSPEVSPTSKQIL